MYQLIKPSFIGAMLVVSSLTIGAISATANETKISTPVAGLKKEPADNAVVARVNGKEITLGQMKIIMRIMDSGADFKNASSEEKDAVINNLIALELLYQAGQKLQIKDIDAQVEAEVVRVKQLLSEEATLVSTLNEIGMDMKSFRFYIQKQIVIENFISAEIEPKVHINAEEIKKYYDENASSFATPERVRALNIFCSNGYGEEAFDELAGTVLVGATEQGRKEAHDNALKLKKEITAGADFAKLAKENKICPSEVDDDLTMTFGDSEMPKELEDVAFSLKPGEVSDVVEIATGAILIKQIEHLPAGKLDDVVIKNIEYNLKSQKLESEVDRFVANAKKNAKIEILLK